jgi:plastocyanin
MISSARAVPLISVGSSASYELKASIQSAQSCNATSATASQVNYTKLACDPYHPVQLVNIYDDSACYANDPSCYFSPSNVTVIPGTTVIWYNSGHVVHTVTSSSFNSGALAPMASFSYSFNTLGNYSYACLIHPWMHGVVRVAIPAYPPPSPVSSSIMPTISFAGSLNWTVNGLDNTVAVLNVSQQVSIIASQGPFSFTPATETGSFSQSINLATRVESPGTATSIILGILQRMLAYQPYYGYNGYPTILGQMLSSQKLVYTFWWVNGPLANGQPVQILTGYSSVVGNEMVSLGPSNDRTAWIVESTLSQSVSTTSPPVITTGGSSNSNFRLDLRFDFDQMSDILLKSSAVVSVTSAQSQGYKPGDYLCGASGCFPVSDFVTVDHHMSATVPITLQLQSTNFDLSKRMPGVATGNGQTTPGPAGTSGTSTLFPPMSLWMYIGIGVVGAGVVAATAWLLRRGSGIRQSPGKPETFPSAAPPVTG